MDYQRKKRSCLNYIETLTKMLCVSKHSSVSFVMSSEIEVFEYWRNKKCVLLKYDILCPRGVLGNWFSAINFSNVD